MPIGILFFICSAISDDASNSLVITSPQVVNSTRAHGNGPWSFVNLFKKSTRPELPLKISFTQWLEEWDKERSDTGFPLAARPSRDLLWLWDLNDDQSLNENKSPFQLIGISFRLDLRSPSKPAGEGRFIFNLMNIKNGMPFDFTMIFEYRLPGSDESALKKWAKRLNALSKLQGEEHLAALETLTRLFTDDPRNLLSVRTNDFYLIPDWELRSFHPENGRLILDVTDQTPDKSFMSERRPELLKYLEDNANAILNGQYLLPRRFLGSAAPVPDDLFSWGSTEVLKAFSKNTCNGCHSADTDTRFQHLSLLPGDKEARLSPFLKMEIENRWQDLQGILEGRTRLFNPWSARAH